MAKILASGVNSHQQKRVVSAYLDYMKSFSGQRPLYVLSLALDPSGKFFTVGNGTQDPPWIPALMDSLAPQIVRLAEQEMALVIRKDLPKEDAGADQQAPPLA